MKYKTPIVLALFLVFTTTSLLAQNETLTDDKANIEQTIQNYFDGWLTGDSTLIGSAMHPSCHLKFFPRGEYGMRTRNQYLSGFKPRPRLEGGQGTIINIDITRNTAAAKVELEIPGRVFTDYFNLLRIEGRWYIMDKISTNIAKNLDSSDKRNVSLLHQFY